MDYPPLTMIKIAEGDRAFVSFFETQPQTDENARHLTVLRRQAEESAALADWERRNLPKRSPYADLSIPDLIAAALQ